MENIIDACICRHLCIFGRSWHIADRILLFIFTWQHELVNGIYIRKVERVNSKFKRNKNKGTLCMHMFSADTVHSGP